MIQVKVRHKAMWSAVFTGCTFLTSALESESNLHFTVFCYKECLLPFKSSLTSEQGKARTWVLLAIPRVSLRLSSWLTLRLVWKKACESATGRSSGEISERGLGIRENESEFEREPTQTKGENGSRQEGNT